MDRTFREENGGERIASGAELPGLGAVEEREELLGLSTERLHLLHAELDSIGRAIELLEIVERRRRRCLPLLRAQCRSG